MLNFPRPSGAYMTIIAPRQFPATDVALSVGFVENLVQSIVVVAHKHLFQKEPSDGVEYLRASLNSGRFYKYMRFLPRDFSEVMILFDLTLTLEL